MTNLHLFAIPFYESHIGQAIFKAIATTLNAFMGIVWAGKLLPVAMNCAANMVSGFQGAVTVFAAVTGISVFRIMGAGHQ